MAAKAHVVLLGDSTLDNVCWTGHPHEVPAQLKALLPDALVTNFAADGFTSTDLLFGAVPAISWGARRAAGDPFPPCGEDRQFAPLELLETLEPKPTHAVLSIGGNDVREILGQMHRLPQIVSTFQQNYAKILDKLGSHVPNVILMFQYRPSFTMDRCGYGVYQAIGSMSGPGDSVQKLNHLMQTIYRPVLNEACARRFAIIDLPRTFDIHNDDLYCCQIEPSSKGGTIIAKLISHVVTNHEFSGPSRLHLLCGDEHITESNTEHLQWTISDASPNDNTHAGRLEEVQAIDTATYKQLCSMGFEPAAVGQALLACGNDQDAALAKLTGAR